MLHHRSPRFVANVITHGLAGVAGGVIVVAIGLGRGTPPVDGQNEVTVVHTEPQRPAVAAPTPSRNSRCSEPPARNEPELAEPDARTMLLELQKASSESMLAELGAMPMTWARVPDVPDELLPEQFEALVARAADDLGLAPPEVDCSECPCVVMAPDEWTSEQFAALRDAVLRASNVEDARPFGVDHGSARMFGVYSEGVATPELLERVWFRVREARHDATITTTEGIAP